MPIISALEWWRTECRIIFGYRVKMRLALSQKKKEKKKERKKRERKVKSACVLKRRRDAVS